MTGFPPAVCDAIDNRAGHLCEVCGQDRIAERHHRRPRGQGGSKRADTNTAANGLGVCRSCHALIESYRNVARLLGWLVQQNHHPADQPVLWRGRWMRLDAAGNCWEAAA